ncbi:MAG: matrixin family metalloprotease [Rhodospirillales bacterium]|nr:matrixin family metalloprotease [Rhodospirillales bacterium]
MVSPNSASASSTVGDSGDYRIDALIEGDKWGGSVGVGATISYSFASTSSVWASGYGLGEPSKSGYQPLNATEQAWFRSALAAWSDVANVKFVETTETSSNVGDIRVAYSSLSSIDSNAYAWSYYPSSYAESGDVWLNDDYSWSYGVGSYSYMTLIHEIGHTLGLKHPFEGGDTLPTLEDNYQYTLMSYTDSDGADVYPSTPMLYDVLAIQYIYGANYATRSGDTVYTSNPGELRARAIWDGGGNDTFDLSAHTSWVDVDLRPGGFSSIGLNSDGSHAIDNIAICFGTVIENAIGGSGDDTIGGNTANNHLDGGGGNDQLFGGNGADSLAGGTGDDLLNGGAGADTLDGGTGVNTLFGAGGDDLYLLSSARDIIIERAGAGIDSVQSFVTCSLSANVENLTLLGSDDIDGTGNALANTLNGNAGANLLAGAAGYDTILGGSGGDTIHGGAGNDSVIGGNGPDALLGNIGNDTLRGGAGDDWMSAGDGRDSLDGGDGRDTLLGGAGADTLNGGAGNDTLDGGGGNDQLFGGAGGDWFLLRDLNNGVAETITIIGYWGSGGDVIDLPLGAASVVSEAHDGDAWVLTLAGDGDVLRLESAIDQGTIGTILDDILFV